MIRIHSVSRLLLGAALSLGAAAWAAGEKAVTFEMHRLGDYKSEACGVGDFNNDGKLDVVAGAYLYLAPEFKPLKIREVKGDVDAQGKGYRYDFMNEPMDVDGDGLLDVAACDWFQKAVWWFRNPGAGKTEPWAENPVAGGVNYETAMLADIDGDGKAREILPHIQATEWYELVKGADGTIKPVTHVISDKKQDFGVGAGDLNGDGRPDVIRPNGWFEAPADPRQGQWKEHPAEFLIAQPKKPDGKAIAPHLSMFLVHDVNGDGLNDLVYTAAHGYGIVWAEQAREGAAITFKRHMIDNTWTQAHSIALADIDGDGVKELITGKRFMAHNGADPEENGALRVCYYDPVKKGSEIAWERHAISEGAGIGAGLNIPVADLDGDGDLDIVVTGKWGGPVWFENKTK